MPYIRANAPKEYDPYWLDQELQKLERAGEGSEFLQLKELHAEPTKPRRGSVYFADGTDWDPGDGQGLYVFDGANFILLGFSGTIDTGDIADGAVTTVKIADGNVTLAKLANLTNQRVIGRNTAGTGVPEEVSLTQFLDWIGSAAQGDILYRAASAWARLGAGTSGHFLKTQGAAANPTWAAVPNPGLVLIATQLASNSATIDFVNGVSGVVLDDTYDAYQILFSSVKPATDGVGLWMRVGTGGTPTWQAGATAYGWNTHDLSGASAISNTSDSEIELITANASSGLGNASGEAASGVVEFSNPEASDFPHFHFRVSHKSAGNATGGNVGIGLYLSASAITGIRFLCSSGNIASGRFSLYGLAKS